MAEHRHKRETNARRKPRAVIVAGPLALLATASAVTLGVLAAEPTTDIPFAAAGASDTSDATASATREAPVTRSLSRSERRELKQPVKIDQAKLAKAKAAKVAAAEARAAEATRAAVRNADTRLWTTALLNLWSAPGDDAEQLGEIDEGVRVLVTGREGSGRVEIVVEGQARWVTEGYLSEEKPVTDVAAADCSNGTSVPSGVSPNVAKVHQAVCAAFPEISTYGTFRSDGEHSQGLAVDIMVSGDRGWQVAEFVREHYADLGVSYVIYAQKIWSVERSGEGWRGMSDRGSTTANHYDHVHVTTY